MLQSDRAATLQRVPIFAKLSDSALERLARSCTWGQHESGEEILSFQDASTRILFLLSGKARVVIYSSEGKAVVFRDLTAGTMFGEIAAIDRRPRSASVRKSTRSALARSPCGANGSRSGESCSAENPSTGTCAPSWHARQSRRDGIA